MIGVVLELSLTFLQFLSALASIPDIDLPDAWASPLYYVKVVNLDLPIFREIFPSLNDFRVYFTVVCVIVPLGLVFFGLFFLNTVGVLLWYLLLLTGFCLAVAGILTKNLRTTLQLEVEDSTADTMITVGLALFIGCGIFAVAYGGWQKKRQAEKEAEEAAAREEETAKVGGGEDGLEPNASAAVERTEVENVMVSETRDFPILATIQRTVMLLFFVAVGLLFLQIFRAFTIGDGFDSVQLGLGITFLVLAAFTLGWTIMGCFRGGRQLQWKFFHAMEQQFMRLLLITMSMLYIPVGAGLFVLFNCNTQSCDANQQFIRENSWLPHNNTPDIRTGRTDICIPCNAPAPQRCGAAQVCTSESQRRLEVDQFIDCDDLVIFNYAAIIIIVMYMVGVPVMFGRLVNLVTGLVLEDFPVKVPKDVDEENVEAMWELKVAQSNNTARFLYQPFVPVFRYTRLYQLLQKLLVVFTAVFVIRAGSVNPIWFALIAGLVIHVISFIWLAARRPFIHTFENGIALLMEFALTGSMVCAVMLLMDYDVPHTALVVIIILNGTLPILAIIIAIVLEWSRRKSKEEQEREEQQAAFEEEMAKREQEDNDREMAESLHHQEQQAAGVHQPHSPSESYGPAGLTAALGAGAARALRPAGDELLNSRATKEALARQRAKEAREAAQRRREAEELAMTGRQNDVDFAINRTVKQRLNMFLMAGGALGFVALGLCIVGLLAKVNSSPTRWDTPYKTAKSELGGYTSWSEFTRECCCRANWGDPSRTDALLVEQWRCANGFIKERIRAAYVDDPTRQTAGAKFRLDGLAIRDVCAVNFNTGCLLLTGGVRRANADADDPSVQAFCSPIVNTTAYAVQYFGECPVQIRRDTTTHHPAPIVLTPAKEKTG
eukprot:CAMPEP_0174832170 /NCGR_PEP_ID=MMETSP1114-20130205/3529_1 /TAXON_ID=312471 /ORGANISM="Neobodo designis, Strain CCAP 1951/1" /LENGTH=889 /DNA_ID=CAMNT_0016066025 /DNA_START=109 /DNA_END=2776 /DNA_ORIENTATION=+